MINSDFENHCFACHNVMMDEGHQGSLTHFNICLFIVWVCVCAIAHVWRSADNFQEQDHVDFRYQTEVVKFGSKHP